MSKDIPIIFSKPMVLALLGGRKSMTRRLVKPPRKYADAYPHLRTDVLEGHLWWWDGKHDGVGASARYPYAAGDRLWVREECWLYGQWVDAGKTKTGRTRRSFNLIGEKVSYEKPNDIAFWGGGPGYSWRPSIHMPRWASRLTLIVNAVKVERLQEITEEDAIAEGVTKHPNPVLGFHVPGIEHPNKDFPVLSRPTAREMFAALWDTVHDSGAWLANPFVVAISFDVVKQNIDALPLAEAA